MRKNVARYTAMALAAVIVCNGAVPTEVQAAKQAKDEETAHHIEEMEKMGYDMTEYKEALAEKIGGATREEVEAAKRETLAADRTIKKGADLVEDDYDPAQHVMRACGEVDGKPNCNRDCKHCMRKHCPYRQE